MTRAALVVAAIGLAAIGGPGCVRDVQAGSACEVDGDCGNAQRCDAELGQCLCIDSSACDGATEFCNLAGRCQPKTGCVANDDCVQGETRVICDTTTATCTALTAAVSCFLDSHCPFGSYCANGQCAPGCRDNGDCPIGDPCIDGACDAREGVCNENGYCAFGDFCDPDTNTCRSHRSKASLCQECRPKYCFDNSDCPAGVQCVGGSFTTLGECDVCGGGAPCLIDSTVLPEPCTQDAQCAEYGGFCSKAECFDETQCAPGDTCVGGDPVFGTLGRCSGGTCGDYFCGNDACDDATDPCPRGYGCVSLITVDPNRSCTSNAQCSGGAACSAGGENNVAGFCSCTADADCPAGTCVNPGPGGYCLTGSTCGPSSGLVCEDLQ